MKRFTKQFLLLALGAAKMFNGASPSQRMSSGHSGRDCVWRKRRGALCVAAPLNFITY